MIFGRIVRARAVIRARVASTSFAIFTCALGLPAQSLAAQVPVSSPSDAPGFPPIAKPVPLRPSPILEPPAVLARYATTLARLKRPKSISFEFSVEQSGLRDLEQTHRVYRAGQSERDETLSADGYTLTSPSVRIFSTRANRYDIGRVAPRLDEYDFTFAGLERAGGRVAYIFHVRPRESASYAVNLVVIDGYAFLPRTIGYTVTSGATKGRGAMSFGASSGYWLIREASVSATVAGRPARERIVFTKYAFPDLPPSTFELPRKIPALPPASDLEAPFAP